MAIATRGCVANTLCHFDRGRQYIPSDLKDTGVHLQHESGEATAGMMPSQRASFTHSKLKPYTVKHFGLEIMHVRRCLAGLRAFTM